MFWLARKFPLALFPIFCFMYKICLRCDLLSLSCCCIYVIEKGTHLGIFYYICFGFLLSIFTGFVFCLALSVQLLKIDTFPLISSRVVFCFVYFHRFHNIQCSSFLVQVKNIALFLFRVYFRPSFVCFVARCQFVLFSSKYDILELYLLFFIL